MKLTFTGFNLMKDFLCHCYGGLLKGSDFELHFEGKIDLYWVEGVIVKLEL